MIPKLGNFRAIYISPVHYARRRERFLASLRLHGGLLDESNVQWFKATPWDKTHPPEGHWFRQVRKCRHYWAATCDHIQILETALVDGIDSLLVLEDDAVFPPGFAAGFEEAVAALPTGWRALQLNWNAAGEGPARPPGIYPAAGNDAAGQMANLWSRAGMARFHSHALANRQRIIDSCYDQLRGMEPGLFFRPARQLILQSREGRGQGKDD